ncbi:c-type cytochrome [Candidatus Endoriftia persephone]|jgi:cytochrome c oxidase cbb3-type subunit 3|uniref:Cytochrome c domain-containing protein n=3 Tax=Gammaproteobacteria TaxID=1236 RepID=G2FFU5_9GAMM|nr:c-type cytochrome [Candidatus Endoriftia persephone]EGW54347.1 hypothetical protein TevJSym_an00540 [endosymbiont of Tevnia jerichonana (vent Tica)]USF87046.1 c-type cytochrome [Candidatus Endoriftia persephone]
MRTLSASALLFAGSLAVTSAALAGNQTEPNLDKGARVFQERCSLCHGDVGMGEGVLPLALKNYPKTNLMEPRYGVDKKSLQEIVIWGGSKKAMHDYSPPWGDELTWTEIESVVMFVQYLHTETEQAVAMLRKLESSKSISLKLGSNIYQGRCAICHGKTGEGNGRMAKIIKNPPPFNLTLSRAPDEYLHQIISKGGEKMSRSYRMPPWGDELSEPELQSVIQYIKTLRRY